MVGRKDRELALIKNVLRSCNDKFDLIGVFYNEKEEVLRKLLGIEDEKKRDALIEDCKKQISGWDRFSPLLKEIEKEKLDGVEVLDIVDSDGLNDDAAAFIKSGFEIRETPGGVSVKFGVRGVYDVIFKGGRNGRYTNLNVCADDNTWFGVFNDLDGFYDKYSIGLRGECDSFGISVDDSGKGIKGSAVVRIFALRGNKLIIDDLSKYTDVSALLYGIHV